MANDLFTSLKAQLDERIAAVAELMPEHMRADAARHVKQAYMYFVRRRELHDVTAASFIQCVLDAAELGLSLDGRMAHAVAYNCKVSKKGEAERWERKAQLMPDWKGLVSVAKRTKQVADIYGDVVCENDLFELRREGPTDTLRHEPAKQQRGLTIGAYAIYVQHDRTWRYEYCTIEDIQHVRSKSKAADDGPWVTDFNEMARKTVVRRGLKCYCDNPTLIRAIEHDERAAGFIEVESRPISRAVTKPPPAIEHNPSPTLNLDVQPEPETVPVERGRREESQPALSVDDAGKLDLALDACDTAEHVDRVQGMFGNGKPPGIAAEVAAACDKRRKELRR